MFLLLLFLLLFLYWRLDDRSLCMEMGDVFVAVIICLFIIFTFRTSADFVFLILMVLLKELIFETIS